MKQTNLRRLRSAISQLAGAIVIAGCGAMAAQGVSAAVVLKDGFESGNLSSKTGAARWNANHLVTVVSDQATSGVKSARFSYEGSSDQSQDAWSELRFDLGDSYPELWIQFNLFVPSNYKHRNVSPNNNKFFRLWPEDYQDRTKVGASLWASSGGTSNMKADWSAPGQAIGPKGQQASGFVSSADLGRWMSVKIHVRAATPSRAGTLNIWKNDKLVIDNTDDVVSDTSNTPYEYRYGYLLGWSNAGFDQDTNFYIDDVIIATQETDLDGSSTGQTAPPEAPSLSVE